MRGPLPRGSILPSLVLLGVDQAKKDADREQANRVHVVPAELLTSRERRYDPDGDDDRHRGQPRRKIAAIQELPDHPCREPGEEEAPAFSAGAVGDHGRDATRQPRNKPSPLFAGLPVQSASLHACDGLTKGLGAVFIVDDLASTATSSKRSLMAQSEPTAGPCSDARANLGE